MKCRRNGKSETAEIETLKEEKTYTTVNLGEDEIGNGEDMGG
jgi:hypothetical protein